MEFKVGDKIKLTEEGRSHITYFWLKQYDKLEKSYGFVVIDKFTNESKTICHIVENEGYWKLERFELYIKPIPITSRFNILDL